VSVKEDGAWKEIEKKKTNPGGRQPKTRGCSKQQVGAIRTRGAQGKCFIKRTKRIRRVTLRVKSRNKASQNRHRVTIGYMPTVSFN